VRVLHVVPAFAPTRGGIEVLLEGLMPTLRVERDITCEVMSPRSGRQRPDDCVVAGARVHSVDLIDGQETRNEARELALIFARVRRVVAESKPDILHVHGYSPLALPAINTARSMEIPYVMHVHGGVEAPLPAHFHRLIREAPIVIAVSQHVGDSLKAVSRREGPVIVIPNGVQVRSLSTSNNAQMARVGMFGRLEPEKGFAEAINALAPLRNRIPDLEIHIAGVGGELLRIQETARSAGVARHVRMHGELSHEQVFALMASCSVIVVPSTAVEGFSLVAAEAGLAGRPVVATSVAGLSETVIDGVTGTLVPLHDGAAMRSSVEKYLMVPEFAALHGMQGQKFVSERFSMSEMAAKVSSVYNRVLRRDEAA
jgi:glycosyltransferase involved in cell wall biosynthesis